MSGELPIMSDVRPSTFTWIYAAGAVVLLLIAIFAVTLAVQEHNDRVLSDEIAGTASDLQDTGARITSIRDADLKDMNDYIRAYSEIAPLLDDYDRYMALLPKPEQMQFWHEQFLPREAQEKDLRGQDANRRPTNV